jgi:putative membrane protein
VFAVGKGAGFYLHNPVFYIKLALFVAVGLVSILPTLQFIRWNRGLKAHEERILRDNDIVTTRRYIGLEMLLLAFIPLMGVLMARGIGLQH